MITVRSTINLAHQNVPNIIPVVQGDTGRAILFTLADFTIPEGATARYFVMKPSGLSVYNDATIDGNTVLVELTAQSIIETGDNYGQVRISVGDDIVTSFDFILHVEQFRGIDAVESSTETNIFDKAVEDAEQAIEDAAEAAEEYIAQAIDPTLSLPDKAADAKATGDAIWNIYPTETAQGNPATFTDGAESIPVKDLKATIVPTQDLHGYDKPWPAGGGKNLFALTNGQTTSSNLVCDRDSVTGIAEVSGTPSSQAVIQFAGKTALPLQAGVQYTFTCGLNSEYPDATFTMDFFGTDVESPAISDWVNIFSGKKTQTFTLANAYKYYRLNLITSASYATPVKFYPMIRKSTDSIAFAPYTNICPITGMTEANVTRTGKNLLPMTVDGIKAVNTFGTWSGNAYTFNGVTFTVQTNGADAVTGILVDGTATANTPFTIAYNIAFTGSHILNGCPSDGNWNTKYALGYQRLDTYSVLSDIGSGVDISSYSGISSAVILMVRNGYATSNLLFKPMIRLASVSDSTFSPYTKQELSISLGRTVYSGVLDVTTGVLTVGHKIIVFDGVSSDKKFTNKGGGENNNYYLSLSDGYLFGFTTAGWVTSSELIAHHMINSHYPYSDSTDAGFKAYIGGGGTVLQPRIQFGSTSTITTLELANQWLANQYSAGTPLQIVYPLATPQTYQLTPQEVRSLYGTNHISTDAESVDVVYRADIGLILKKMSDSLLPYLPLTMDGTFQLAAEVSGGEKELYWWTQQVEMPMMSSMRQVEPTVIEKTISDNGETDLIDRQAAITTAENMRDVCDTDDLDDYRDLVVEALEVLPTREEPMEEPTEE